LHDLVLLPHVGEDGRLDEEAAALVRSRSASGQDRRALRPLEEAEDPLLLVV
jgi:hypothetical protein